VHAKGIILQGEFTPDTHAKEITKAPHLQGPSSKVTVRFSDFSGVPTIPDNDPMANP
jgi:catalase